MQLPPPSVPGSLQGVVEWVTAILQLAAALALAWGIVTTTARVLGRRRTLARKLRSLAPGARIEYFEQVLGQASFRRPYGPPGTAYTWVEPEVYVHAFVKDDFVRVYSVTIRTRWFRPALGNFLGAPPGRIKLGRTKFGDLWNGSDDPGTVSAFVGARRHGYAEIHGFGNPGGYREFAFAINDAGVLYDDDDYIALVRAGETLALAKGEVGEAYTEKLGRVAKLRSEARFNTYAVSAPLGNIKNSMVDMPVVGANLDEVRVMDDYALPWQRWLWRLRWWRRDRRFEKRHAHQAATDDVPEPPSG